MKQYTPESIKFLIILCMVYVTILLLSGILAYKLIQVRDFTFSAAILVFPISYITIDITAEIFGYKISRIFIWIGTICVYLFALFGAVIIHLPSPLNWHHQASYNWIIGLYLRLTIAGSISTLVGEFINTFVISKWKILTKGKVFALRSIGSSGIGAFFDTLCEYLIGFTGIISSTHLLFSMIILAYTVKLFYSCILAYPASLIVKFLKTKTNLDTFDYRTNFNPFSLELDLKDKSFNNS